MLERMSLIFAAAQSTSIAGDIAWNVANHVRIGAIAAEQRTQLLVFPELSLTGYELAIAREHALRPDSPALDPLREFAVQAGMHLAAGAPMPNEKEELHIAAFLYCPDGSVGVYTKVYVHESEEPVFTSGPGGPTLIVGEASVGLAICADASHPEHAAKAARLGSHVYACGAMIDDIGYARKSRLLQGYAVEHGMAVLLANYAGVTGGEVSAGKSAIWSEDGQVVAASEGTEESLVIGRKDGSSWRGLVVRL